MNLYRLFKWFFLVLIIMSPLVTNAAAPSWEIVPTESSITFTGIQNDAPASGSIKKFNGRIQFDPKQLNDSKVRIVIDMNSITTSYIDFTTTLLTEDWFNVKLFPKAVFETTKFKKTDDNHYQATGTLKIRDKIVPVTLTFEAKELSPSIVLVKGNTTLKRTQFGIGQGEWADTEAVKDVVNVNFQIVASKKL